VHNYKTKGIILKRQNFGEADRILTILTQNHGKIRVVAKGVRKTLSHLAGHLEPFCVTEFLISEGRNLDIISGAVVRKCHMTLRSDLGATQTAFYLAEITERMLQEKDAHSEIFELLDETLEHLNMGPAELLISYYELNFLALMGFYPELNKCVQCGGGLKDKNYIDFQAGGTICQKCSFGRPVSNDTIKTMRLFLAHQLSTIKKIKTQKKLVTEISNIVSDYIRHHHQKEFKSRRFLTKRN